VHGRKDEIESLREYQLHRFEPPNRRCTVLIHIVALRYVSRGGGSGKQCEVAAIGQGIGGGVGDGHRSEIFQTFSRSRSLPKWDVGVAVFGRVLKSSEVFSWRPTDRSRLR
jgi:hypothetical protein